MSYNSIDIVLILLVGLSVLSGFMSGFSRLIVGLISTVAGIFVGFWFYGIPAAVLRPYVSRPEIANALGFLIILICTLILGGVLGRVLASLFKWVGLSWFDRLLGGGAGFLRGVLVAVALVTIVLACAPKPPPRVIVDSKLLPYVMTASRVLATITPSELKQAFEETEDKVREIWDQRKLPHLDRPENKA